MERFELSEDYKPGTWGYIETGDIRVVCKECGAHMHLDHRVDSDGRVHPAIACYVCGFHDWIQLMDWKERRQ